MSTYFLLFVNVISTYAADDSAAVEITAAESFAAPAKFLLPFFRGINDGD